MHTHSHTRLLICRVHSQDWQIDYKELTIGRLLGKGSQGEVFKAQWRGTEVACKKVDMRKVSPDIIEEFCQEAEIMRRLRHPCLTLFMGKYRHKARTCKFPAHIREQSIR